MTHKVGCPELRARLCAAPIECPHGYDCCPICDPCTCRKSPRAFTVFEASVFRVVSVGRGHSATSVARVLYPRSSGRYAGAVGRTLARLADRGLVQHSRRDGWHKTASVSNGR